MLNKFYIPKKLCIENLLPEKYSYLKEEVHLQRLYQLVELVCIRGLTYGKDYNLWCNLHCRCLENQFTRMYSEYKKALIVSGIILCGEEYIKGRYSKRYRISPEYEGDYRPKKITNSRVLKKMNARHHMCNSFEKVCIHMYRFLEDITFSRQKIHAENIHQAKAMGFIYEKLFYLKRDAYGRVHTNITNLKRRHRKQLRYHGQKLYNVDIKNSQPLLLNILLNKLIQKSIIKETADIIKYRKLTQSGRFYNHISKLYKVPEDKKERLKPRLFRHVFFGKKTAKKFAVHFPEVAKALVYLKKPDFKNLARELQKVESELFIDNICGKIMNEKPEVPVITIHDSILTTAENIGYVKQIIREEFFKEGLRVSV